MNAATVSLVGIAACGFAALSAGCGARVAADSRLETIIFYSYRQSEQIWEKVNHDADASCLRCAVRDESQIASLSVAAQSKIHHIAVTSAIARRAKTLALTGFAQWRTAARLIRSSTRALAAGKRRQAVQLAVDSELLVLRGSLMIRHAIRILPGGVKALAGLRPIETKLPIS